MRLFGSPAPLPFGPRLRWIWMFLSLLFTAGLFLDGWAHIHVPELETFFTPWHAVFYAGYFLTTATLLFEVHRRSKRPKKFGIAVPTGQHLTLLGCVLFLLGGIGDLTWHQIFGVENDLEALLSPTHLVLALSMFLIVSGGIRDEWVRARDGTTLNLLRSLPYAVSLACTLAVPVFLTQFAEYTDFPFAAALEPHSETLHFYQQASPILGALLFSALLVGVLSKALQRGRLPFGTVTLVIGSVVSGIAVARYGWEYIPAALVAGLVGDTLLEIAEWSRNRVRWLRIFAFVLPAVYYKLVILTLLLINGTWLTIHMWAGIPVLAGLAGLLVGVLATDSARE